MMDRSKEVDGLFGEPGQPLPVITEMTYHIEDTMPCYSRVNNNTAGFTIPSSSSQSSSHSHADNCHHKSDDAKDVFKYSVTLSGTNVLASLQEMYREGLVERYPNCVLNMARLGRSEITVRSSELPPSQQKTTSSQDVPE